MITSIAKTKCSENQKINFLPKHLDDQYISFEIWTYTLMDKASKDYHGGNWDFYSLSNGGIYMKLNSNKMFNMVQSSNYYEGIMSADAASISVNLMALYFIAEEHNIEYGRFGKAGGLFHFLKDYAYDHEESGEILRFID